MLKSTLQTARQTLGQKKLEFFLPNSSTKWICKTVMDERLSTLCISKRFNWRHWDCVHGMSLNHAVMQAMLCDAMLCDVEFAEYFSLHFFHIPGWSICHDRRLLIQNVRQKDLTQLMMSHEELPIVIVSAFTIKLSRFISPGILHRQVLLELIGS